MILAFNVSGPPSCVLEESEEGFTSEKITILKPTLIDLPGRCSLVLTFKTPSILYIKSKGCQTDMCSIQHEHQEFSLGGSWTLTRLQRTITISTPIPQSSSSSQPPQISIYRVSGYYKEIYKSLSMVITATLTPNGNNMLLDISIDNVLFVGMWEKDGFTIAMNSDSHIGRQLLESCKVFATVYEPGFKTWTASVCFDDTYVYQKPVGKLSFQNLTFVSKSMVHILKTPMNITFYLELTEARINICDQKMEHSVSGFIPIKNIFSTCKWIISLPLKNENDMYLKLYLSPAHHFSETTCSCESGFISVKSSGSSGEYSGCPDHFPPYMLFISTVTIIYNGKNVTNIARSEFKIIFDTVRLQNTNCDGRTLLTGTTVSLINRFYCHWVIITPNYFSSVTIKMKPRNPQLNPVVYGEHREDIKSKYDTGKLEFVSYNGYIHIKLFGDVDAPVTVDIGIEHVRGSSSSCGGPVQYSVTDHTETVTCVNPIIKIPGLPLCVHVLSVWRILAHAYMNLTLNR